MALSALLLLLPLLLNVQKIPDESVQSDMNAVYLAIESSEQWKDPNNSLATLEAKLTDPQRALAKMHWELETIQKERPMAPPQFDLRLFSDALETIVEMDEEAKEVRLRKDKLIEWAGGKAAKEKKEKAAREAARKSDAPTDAMAEVRVSGKGEVKVRNGGAGGVGHMEVRRTTDEKGVEEVVITFVKSDDTEGPAKGAEDKPQEGLKLEEMPKKEEMPKTEEKPRMEEIPKREEVPKTDEVSKKEEIAGTEEKPTTEEIPKTEEVPKKEKMPKTEEEPKTEEMPRTEEKPRTEEEMPKTEEKPRTEEMAKKEEMPKTEEVPKKENKPQGIIGWFLNLFRRNKRATMDGEPSSEYYRRAIRSIENLNTVGSPGSEFLTKLVNSAKLRDRQAEAKSEGAKTDDEKKAEIREHLEEGMANTDGSRKAEKMAYVWYSELLYWTTKWIEALETRMAGVQPELTQQFLSSTTGTAAHKELEEEVRKCEAKLAKLRQWIGLHFK